LEERQLGAGQESIEDLDQLTMLADPAARELHQDSASML
jgi:hypothetical protein